jgi:hypothetical protein
MSYHAEPDTHFGYTREGFLMSKETNVYAFRPGDAKWREMKARWDECERSRGELPQEVLEFFDYREPGPGEEVGHAWIGAAEFPEWATRYWEDSSESEGFEVDLTKLPEGTTVLRFVNER